MNASVLARLLCEVVDGDHDTYSSDKALYAHHANRAGRVYYKRRAKLLLTSPEWKAHEAAIYDEGWNASADYMSPFYTGADDPPNPYEDAP